MLTRIPIDPTPLEHVGAVAVTAKCAGEVTVESFAGLLTVTAEYAGVASASRIKESWRKKFIVVALSYGADYTS